jgi:tetratricopeptide (TPR) repeat protein
LAEALSGIRSEKALEEAERATTLNPLLVDAWRELGDARAEARQFDGAIEAFEKAAALDPGYGLVHAKRAQVLLEQGRRIEALEAVQKAADLGGDAFFVAAIQGDVYSAMDRHRDAAEAYDTALLFEPEDHWTLHQAALEHGQAGDFDRAAELFEKALEFDRDGCHQTLVDYAQLMRESGRIGDAVKLLKKAVNAVPYEQQWRQWLKDAEEELRAAPN